VIIVNGLVRLQSERLAEAIAISLEHVHRSRAEPGCVSHAVYQDVEDPLTLHFFERWEDRDALVVHFAVPESVAFAKALAGLATERPEVRIYEAEATRI
jgi:quinol monooxygenase YgiN